MKRILMRQFCLAMLLCCFLVMAASSVQAGVAQGRVMKVSDGDTVTISPHEGGQFYKCRLYGIDAPELSHGHNKPGQPYGEEAMRELKQLILGQNVEVEIKATDRYHRKVCRISRDGVDINLEMIKRGMG
ncbi:MAG: thermonuclease family protein, partial [Nitrospirae bacterium]|nr:thermonuclease family protein [Nitrospirota bacterium]